MSELVEKRNELEKAQARMDKVAKQAYDENGNFSLKNIEELPGKSASEKFAAYQKLEQDIKSLTDEVNSLAEMERNLKAKGQYKHPGGNESEEPKQHKSIGEMFTESAAYKEKGKGDTLDVSLKTLFETSAGWSPEDLRSGRVVEDAQRPIQIIDLIPMGSTNQSAVVYMEETTFTSNAAETAEGNSYGESALALTEQTSQVRKIATFLPVTDEQLEDVAQVRGYINRRLRFMLRQRLDSQIVNGDGSAPNLTGILNVSGLQSQAKGSDPVPDAVHKAITKVRVTGRVMPNAVLMHPNDWQGIRLTRTTEGVYIWGSPSEAGEARIWGLPVVISDALPEGTAIVGDYANFIELAERRGIEVSVSDSHSDYFIKGKQAIRADMRAALPIYRPAAFCEVTSI
jgi:HK97 family phage major capsid protein